VQLLVAAVNTKLVICPGWVCWAAAACIGACSLAACQLTTLQLLLLLQLSHRYRIRPRV
jgi:hypothetical protein